MLAYLQKSHELCVQVAHNKNIYLDGENPFKDGTSRYISTVTKSNQVSEILWTPMFKESGRYGVYVSYVDMPSNVSDAQYVVCHKGVKTSFTVNQQMGGGTWTYLGTFDFDTDAPQDNYVSLSNLSKSEGTISADAVRFGGGMGNIARGDSLEEKISGFPRFLEGARYDIGALFGAFGDETLAPFSDDIMKFYNERLDEYEDNYNNIKNCGQTNCLFNIKS